MRRRSRNHRTEFEVEREKRFLAYIGIEEYPYRAPKPDWDRHPDPSKILDLADLHEPYADPRVIRAAMGHKDAATLIMPGDIGDFYSKSRFAKKKYVTFKEELYSVFKRLEWASQNFRNVIVMLGNHDNRPEKMLLGIVDKREDLLVLTEQNLLRRLASYFDNVQVVGTQIGGDIELTHVYQHGDIVFTHAEISRAQTSAISERISGYLHRWGRQLRLKPYRIIAQAHNHRADKLTMDGETWFLTPCGMNVESPGGEYIFSSRLIGNPPQVGYAVFYQTNGVTDANRSYNWVL